MSEQTSTVERELFIAQIPFEAGENKATFEKFLRSLLEGHGVVVDTVRFIHTPPPKREFKGYGFAAITLRAGANLEAIIEAVNGTSFWERELVIKGANPRPPKPVHDLGQRQRVSL